MHKHLISKIPVRFQLSNNFMRCILGCFHNSIKGVPMGAGQIIAQSNLFIKKNLKKVFCCQ